jgi:hypothetical protein
MTTQYTTILKLALPVQGELSGTWGDVVNDNITQMVEQAVAGKAVVNTWTGNSHTLTTADGTTSESRCAILELTDSGTALTGAGTVVCPTNTKLYIVDNNTAEIITVQTVAGTGVAVPVGKTMLVYCDGTNVVEGVTHANSLSLGTSTVTADKILDEDNMASDSATAIATQQSIKAYVDSQVGTVDTLSEILANGNTTGANDIDVDSAQKVQFRDAAIYINSSVDGQLDIVADGEVQIDTALVDINGNLDVSGTTNISGSVSFTKNAIAGVAISTTSRSSNTVTVTTSAVHGLTSGDLVNVNGVADTSFNGYFTVSVSSTTVFTYNQTGSDGSSTGGTSTEVVYNLNASGTALNWMNGPLNIAANSGIDGLEITQSGAGNGLHVTGTTGLTGNLDVGGTTNDGTALVQIAQSGTGRAFSVNRNVVSATRAVVNLAQLQASGGTEAVLDIQQTTPASRAIKVTPDGSIDRFSVYGTGALVTTPVAGGHAVFNEGGVDADFRVESDSSTHALFVDGSNGNVGIGTSSPSVNTEIRGSASNGQLRLGGSTTATYANIYSDNDGILILGADAGNNAASSYFGVEVDGTERMRIDSSGLVAIGTSSPVSTAQLTIGGTSRIAPVSGNGLLLASGGSDRMFISTAGNVGIGVVPPSSQVSYIRNVQIQGLQAYGHTGINDWGGFFTNSYIDAAGVRKYISSSQYAHNLHFDNNGSFIFYNAPNTNSAGDTVPFVERMRIDASGNFLVGKTSSDTNVEGSVLFADSSSGAAGAFTSDGNRTIIANRKTDDGEIISIRKDGTTVGSIGSISGVVSYINSGNFFVGATALTADANFFGTSPGNAFSDFGHITGVASGVSYTRFLYAGSVIGSITQSGTIAVLYNTSSDQRLKENIADADDAGSKIDAIQVRKFDWKADGSHQDYGMIAQELQAVAPEAVSGDADSEEMMGVDYSKLVPMMLKEIQSLRARVSELES